MMGPVERIALLFGWPAPGLGAQASETIDYINSELKRIRPKPYVRAVRQSVKVASITSRRAELAGR